MDDRYMLFDAGPFGYGHQHEDALSFVIYAYGKYMLVDPGNYPYDSSEWRKYVLCDAGAQHDHGRWLRAASQGPAADGICAVQADADQVGVERRSSTTR